MHNYVDLKTYKRRSRTLLLQLPESSSCLTLSHTLLILLKYPIKMLFSTIFNPSFLLMGLQLLSGVMASPIEESTGSLVARDLALDQSKALAGHNGRRRQLGIAPLVWDTELEAAAQKYVHSLADTKARYIISPVTTRMDQGENSRVFT
jgi:hypothetical protein